MRLCYGWNFRLTFDISLPALLACPDVISGAE